MVAKGGHKYISRFLPPTPILLAAGSAIVNARNEVVAR